MNEPLLPTMPNVSADYSGEPNNRHWIVTQIAGDLQYLIECAADVGMVVTIELEPVGHAMGSYVMHGHVRGAR